MDPLANGSGAASTQDQRNYGMTISAMSQYAKSIGMPNSSGMVTVIMNDASDGHVNGMGGGMMQTTAGTVWLADAVQAFMQSVQNHSGLTVQDMQALMDKLRNSNGTIQ